jgi:uncharacterized Zn finger protein (UPF0148 family)
VNDKYRELDTQISRRTRAQLIADGVTKYPTDCELCCGTGKFRMHKRGRVETCHICEGTGQRMVAI